jgi:PAS domain S-box-containing protein
MNLRWFTAGLMGCSFLLLILGGYAVYRHEAMRLRAEAFANLRVIGDLKADQVVRWRNERLADARLHASGIIMTSLLRWLREGGPEESRLRLQERLRQLRILQDYQDVLLITDHGEPLLSTRRDDLEVEAGTRALVLQVAATGVPMIGELFPCQQCADIHLDIAAPVLNDDGHTLAVLVLRADPTQYLYPLLEAWPTASASAETLLVRQDGAEVVILNKPRHRATPALHSRIPLDQTDVTYVQAAHGHTGAVSGVDYRGVRVLSDIRQVPGSAWFMLNEIDEAEALAGLRLRGYAIATIIILAILLAITMAGYLGSARRRALYRTLYRTERRRSELDREIRATLYSIGDGVITTDARGCVTRVNPVAEQLTGWSEADAIGKPIQEVFRIINEDSRATVDNPVDHVLREGAVVGLANHTLLIARDGVERPIADSGAPVRDASGAITGTVLVFRDQSAERAAHNALRDAAQLLRTVIDTIPVRVFWKDRELRYLGGNQLLARDAGVATTDDIVGKDDFQMAWHAHAEAYRELDRTIIASGDPHLGREEILTTPTGKRIWQRTNKVPLRDHDGAVIGILGTYEDITEWKEAEARLSAQIDELQRWYRATVGRESRVRELKAEINKLLARLGEPPRYRQTEETHDGTA